MNGTKTALSSPYRATASYTVVSPCIACYCIEIGAFNPLFTPNMLADVNDVEE